MSAVVDASVIVASMRATEAKNRTSRRFLLQLSNRGNQSFAPAIIIPECACAMARYLGRSDEGQRAAQVITRMTWLQLEPVSTELASLAAQIGAECRTRGADSCYIALAKQTDATLVTWDREMLERGATMVTAMTPEQWLQQYGEGVSA